MDVTFIKNAREYLQLGWSIIPLKPLGKESLIKWKEYEHSRPSEEQIENWWGNWPKANIGVVLGEISGIFVVDIDAEQGEIELKAQGIYFDKELTVLQRTGRGKHYFYKYPEIGIKNRCFHGGEIKSNGTYVVIAPSIHPSGAKYQWVNSPFNQILLNPPDALIEMCSCSTTMGPVENANKQKIKVGERNNNLIKIAGKIHSMGFDKGSVFKMISGVNQGMCEIPLDEKEVDAIATSVSKYPVNGNQRVKGIQDGDNDSKMKDHKAIPLQDIESEEVQYLWYPYIPIGKLTSIEGDPGVGKSWLTAAILSAVSIGHGLPDMIETDPTNSLLLSAEDGAADTIKPRLIKMGADCEKIFIIPDLFSLDEAGLIQLEKHIKEMKPRLVVIDPLVAYVGSKIDLNRSNQMRGFLTQLGGVAQRNSCAVVFIRHLTKGARDKGIYRGAGSIDITATCRSVLLIGMNQRNPKERGMVHIKSNLSAKGKPRGFELKDGVFDWCESDLNEFDILSPDSYTHSKSDQATLFLKRSLADGPIPALQIIEEAKANNVSTTTLYRVKKELGVESKKTNVAGNWEWALKS